MRRNTIQDFHKRILKTKGCWLWQGNLDTKGYGRFSLFGKVHKAHRLSYQEFKGKVPKELFVCHKCDNPQCVNPKHLFLGTIQDNLRDMYDKGRGADRHGEKSTNCKLTNVDVLIMREALEKGFRCIDVRKYFKISSAHISAIKYKRRWSHI